MAVSACHLIFKTLLHTHTTHTHTHTHTHSLSLFLYLRFLQVGRKSWSKSQQQDNCFTACKLWVLLNREIPAQANKLVHQKHIYAWLALLRLMLVLPFSKFSWLSFFLQWRKQAACCCCSRYCWIEYLCCTLMHFLLLPAFVWTREGKRYCLSVIFARLFIPDRFWFTLLFFRNEESLTPIVHIFVFCCCCCCCYCWCCCCVVVCEREKKDKCRQGVSVAIGGKIAQLFKSHFSH